MISAEPCLRLRALDAGACAGKCAGRCTASRSFFSDNIDTVEMLINRRLVLLKQYGAGRRVPGEEAARRRI